MRAFLTPMRAFVLQQEQDSNLVSAITAEVYMCKCVCAFVLTRVRACVCAHVRELHLWQTKPILVKGVFRVVQTPNSTLNSAGRVGTEKY